MTQTLIDFVRILTERGASAASPPEPSPLQRAKARFDGKLRRLNDHLAAEELHGRLVGVPLCPSACADGPLADLVMSLNTDPYQDWNMMLYADTEAAAEELDTLAFQPDYVTDTDAVMVQYLTTLRRKRDNAFQSDPQMTAQERTAILDSLRDGLVSDCARIEQTIFGSCAGKWRRYVRAEAAPVAPPSAAINPAISAGSGAENSMNAPSTG